MIEFAWPWAFAALPLPLLAWWLLPPYREQRASVQIPFFARIAEATGQTPQKGSVVVRRLALQMIVAAIIWLLIVVALARPQQIGDPISHDISARDIMLAIDISGSMDETDFEVADKKMIRRLDGVKQVVDAFIARRKGDRIGLILFGTKAYIQCPFTQDLSTIQSLLNQTKVGMAGEQTAIGDAIGLTIKAFESSKAQQKMLILLTDGNDTASRVPPAHAADIAQQRGLVIYTIGIGDPNATGENRVDFATLRSVASTTGGSFFRAENGEQLKRIYADIDKVVPVKLQTETWRPSRWARRSSLALPRGWSCCCEVGRQGGCGMLEHAVTNFHLLRPWWLAALIPVALILFMLLRRERYELQWTGAIAPNLLKYMTVTPERRSRIRPAWLVALVLALAIVALAGPTWLRELPPFVEDKAPLMIALDVSASMGGTDIAPSRLERGKQKVRDLLAARGNARTGLIAFAGSAHLVMPLTDDRRVAAVELAAKALTGELFAGTILIVSDDVGNAPAAELRRAAGRNGLLMLSVVPADKAQSPIDNVVVTVDSSDIQAISRRIDTHFQSAEADKIGARWRDEGFWLLLPIALLSLFWFRRGVAVQWALLMVLLLPAPGHGQTADASWRFMNLWLTPDQQGRIAFDRGDYHRATQLFVDPMWRGIAAYRAYDFIAARDAFRKIDSVEGRFALGNAEAQNHAYETAIKLYQEVLKQQPDNAAAKANLAIVRAAYEAAEAKRRKEEQSDPDAPTYKKLDAMKFDKQQKGGKRIQVTPQDLTTPGAAEAWMREVQTTPADFLKLKFAIQVEAGSPPAATGMPK